MKKLTVLLCTVLVLIMSVTLVSASENVEIVFCVGDSTLSINGNDVTVETPYVVEGTTLVPVRVITEAFGAEVGWEDATRTVTITYSDVTITLSIGSDKAYINGTETTLLAAPELTNSTTMVPLRFITETFGADVTYDEATEGITVVKEMTESNSIKDYSLILKRSSKEYIGDSYLGWSMKRTPALKLVSRSFDGRENEFVDSNTNGEILLSFLTNFEGEDQIDVDEALEQLRTMSGNFTTNRLEKGKTPQGYDYAVVRYRSSDGYQEHIFLFKDETTVLITAYMDIEGKQKDFDELCAIIETFDFVFVSTQAEDLSDVNTTTNKHTFKSDFMGLEIDIPGYLVEVSDNNKLNEARFFELNNSVAALYDRISIAMYSIVGQKNSKYWAEHDYMFNQSANAEKYYTFTPVKSIKINEKYAWSYTYEYKYNGKTYITNDVFIDYENYFYNIAFTFEESEKDMIDAVINSIRIEEPNKEEIGSLLRTDNAELNYKDFTIDASNVIVNAPSSWDTAKDTNSLILVGSEGIASIYCVSKASVDNMTGYTYAQRTYELLKANNMIKDLKAPKKIDDINNTYLMTYKTEVEDSFYNCYYHIIDTKDYIILYEFSVLEPGDGARAQEIKSNILNSLGKPIK